MSVKFEKVMVVLLPHRLIVQDILLVDICGL